MRVSGLILSLLVLSLTAVTGTYAEESVKFRYLGVNDGLSQHDITDVIQDKYGYVWIATYDGLNRYDGKKIEVFRHKSADQGTLSGNRILCLYEDSSDRIWIGTEGSGINCYSQITGRITRLAVPDNYRKINSFAEIDGRRVLSATSNGVLMIDTEVWECKPVLESSVYGLGVNRFFRWNDELFVLTDQGICTYGQGEYRKIENLPAGAYRAAAAAEDGAGFFAATSAELFFFSPDGGGERLQDRKDRYRPTGQYKGFASQPDQRASSGRNGNAGHIGCGYRHQDGQDGTQGRKHCPADASCGFRELPLCRQTGHSLDRD